MPNSFARANPLLSLTAEEYKDFASALVSYVALHATVGQTTHFMNLFRDYTREIAGKVAVASKVRRQSVSVPAKGARRGVPNIVVRSALKKSHSH